MDIPDVKYDTEIALLGLQVSITLTRPGFRVKKRKIRKASVGKNQLITREEAIEYVTTTFTKVKGEEQ